MKMQSDTAVFHFYTLKSLLITFTLLVFCSCSHSTNSYHLIESALKEDIGDGDHSTLCSIPADERASAILKIKQEGILAGMQVAEKIFRYPRTRCHV